MNNFSVLVTGGAGFIGSNIVKELIKKNVKFVRILDNLSTGHKENINQFLKYENVEFILGDITDLDTCTRAMKNIDRVIHQAALGSVPRSIDNPLNSHISNVNGFLNILLSAKQNNIKRVVYASSSSVYGDEPLLPKIEDRTGNVLSPYAATKKIDEIYAHVFTQCYDMECIGLRYFNIFGPNQRPDGPYAAVIPKFIELMKQGKSPVIHGDGSFSRDFTFVENAVSANILATLTNNEECFGQIFNVGCGEQHSLNQLVNYLNKHLETCIEPIYGEERKGDIPHSNADIKKIKAFLNYKPLISFEKGIEKTLNFYKKKL